MFNAPFHCFEKIIIFNWIEGAGHGRQVEQEVIIRNNNLLFHFRGHNNDLLVLKQWKGSLTTRRLRHRLRHRLAPYPHQCL